MINNKADRIQNAINHIKTATDIDPWAMEIAVEAMEKELKNSTQELKNPNDAISRQAAIDALGDEPEVWSGDDEYAQGLNNQWHYDVNSLKAVPSVQPEPHWIPVTERLPEPRIDVWVNSDIGQIQGYYEENAETWYASFGQGRDYLELIVNAWMPLPEPYKED